MQNMFIYGTFKIQIWREKSHRGYELHTERQSDADEEAPDIEAGHAYAQLCAVPAAYPLHVYVQHVHGSKREEIWSAVGCSFLCLLCGELKFRRQGAKRDVKT